jgi:hypothetical protein
MAIRISKPTPILSGRSRRSGLWCLLGLSCLVLAAPAGAVPVDLSDPTLRTIQVELEGSPCNPSTPDIASCRIMASDPGAVFNTVLSASFEIVAGEAIVTIAGGDWQQVLYTQQGMGSTAPHAPGILPGTTSDAVLTFDVATGLPTAWDWTSTLHFSVLGMWLDIPLTNTMAPSPNDVYFRSFLGTPLALNCVGVGGPAPGPGQCTSLGETHLAYDPLTGTITALGAVANGIVRPAWGPADWRLSEVVPEPAPLVLLAAGALGLVRLGRHSRGRVARAPVPA